jgi:general L-amino acid transport system permease protein
VTAPTLSQASNQPIPFYRDVRKIAVLLQIAFVAAVLFAAYLLYRNISAGLDALGLSFGFNFLNSRAGFDIKEGATTTGYSPNSPYYMAFVTGAFNTARVSLIAIVFATLLGLVAGISRLSTNKLASTISQVYVELIRNTPLLVQIFFWYNAVILKFPNVRDAINVSDMFYLSRRGIAVPGVAAGEGFAIFAGAVLLAFAVAWMVYNFFERQSQEQGQPLPSGRNSLLAFLAIVAVGWFLARTPLIFSLPELPERGFNFATDKGFIVSPEFLALLIGLSVYTGSFIAEIVRAGILAVSKGQVEAARALGLTQGQTLRLVVLPQALRVIIPPLTSQYLNLTKNSSLAFAIAYPELFGISTTIGNQSGQNLQIILIVAATYLAMSLTISAFLNWYNQRVALVER